MGYHQLLCYFVIKYYYHYHYHLYYYYYYFLLSFSFFSSFARYDGKSHEPIYLNLDT